MAYTPINWQTGDTITAAKLNKCDNGWSVESTTLFNETLTTASGDMGYEATMAYTGDPASIAEMTITFDGTEYVCQQQSSGGTYWYGESSPSGFPTYPFVCLYTSGAWYLITETAGTYSISASTSATDVSSAFTKAVNTATADTIAPFLIELYNTTWQEVWDAMSANRLCFVNQNDGETINYFIAVTADSTDYSVYAINPNGTGTSVGIMRYTATSADDVLSD